MPAPAPPSPPPAPPYTPNPGSGVWKFDKIHASERDWHVEDPPRSGICCANADDDLGDDAPGPEDDDAGTGRHDKPGDDGDEIKCWIT